MARGLNDNLLNTGTTSDAETEKALLSLCMRKEEGVNSTVGKKLIKEDFSDPRNGLIFDAITRLFLNDERIDRFTVSERLKKDGNIERAGGYEYIYEVAESPAVLSNVSSYVKIIRDKSDMRRLIKTLDDLRVMTGRGKSTGEVVDAALSRLGEFKTDEQTKGFEIIREILKSNLEEIQNELKGDPAATKKVKTGFARLDNMMGGLRPGSLNIIAARPGMGKSALAINIATYVAANGKGVAIFSLEMSKTEIGNRLLSAGMTYSSVNSIMYGHRYGDREREDLDAALTKVGRLPIYIDDNSMSNPITMKSKLTELIAQPNVEIGLIVVDYLQLMTMPGRGQSNRQNEIADVSRSLKVLAKEFDVPIIALSQMSRDAAKRDDHTPQLSDLRDSGAIEQDADTVIFIDRPDYYNKGETPDPEESDIKNANLYLAKNRHGSVGKIKVKWEPKRTRFFELDTKKVGDDPEESGKYPRKRTTTSDAAASDYKFTDDQVPPPEEPVYDYPDADDVAPIPEATDAPDDILNNPNSDYPDGFLDD